MQALGGFPALPDPSHLEIKNKTEREAYDKSRSDR